MGKNSTPEKEKSLSKSWRENENRFEFILGKWKIDW
jgi:hypothetical protein